MLSQEVPGEAGRAAPCRAHLPVARLADGAVVARLDVILPDDRLLGHLHGGRRGAAAIEGNG